jgi:hypothetical protein
MAKPFRVGRNLEAKWGVGEEEQRRRFILLWERRVVGAVGARGGGGSGGARSGLQRKKTVGLTDRMGPPVSERRPNQISSIVEETDKCSDGPTGPDREGGDEPWLGWKIREEPGPKPFLGLKSNRVKENQF